MDAVPRTSPAASTIGTMCTVLLLSPFRPKRGQSCQAFFVGLGVPHDSMRVANPTAWTVYVPPRGFHTTAAVDQVADRALCDRHALQPSGPAPTIGALSESAYRFTHFVAPFCLAHPTMSA